MLFWCVFIPFAEYLYNLNVFHKDGFGAPQKVRDTVSNATTPLKTDMSPRKINGWKMYFLLK